MDTYLKKLLSFCHKCGISFEGYKGVLNHWNNDHREEQPKFQCKFSICEYVANKGDQVRIRNLPITIPYSYLTAQNSH